MLKNKLSYLALSALVLTSVGCSSKSDDKPSAAGSNAPSAAPTAAKTDPVTLKVFQLNAGLTDDEFKTMIAEPVKKKYPYITVELVRADKDNTPANLVAGGNLPDLIFTESVGLNTMKDLNAIQDLTDLYKKNNFDFNRLEPYVVDLMKAFGDKGEIFGSPFSVNPYATYYNKDIFDKFGVSYPKDGMTWDEYIDLAKKLTRDDGGVHYYGFFPGGFNLMSGQGGLEMYDPKTQKTSLTGDGWAKLFQTYKAVFDIPGNNFTGNNINAFEKDKVIAMMSDFGARIGELETLHNQNQPVNFDLSTLPVFKDKPQQVGETQVHMLLLSKTSKNVDAAYKVMETVTDDNNQLEMNKKARKTVLKDTKIKEQFGASLNSLKGKNTKAVLFGTPAPTKITNKYANIVRGELNVGINKVKAGSDINTVLRETEDSANQKIQAELKK